MIISGRVSAKNRRTASRSRMSIACDVKFFVSLIRRCRFHVVSPCEPQNRDCTDLRIGKCVLEPPLQEDDLVVEKAVALEILLPLLFRDRKELVRVMEVAGIIWILFRVGGGKPLEGVRHIDAAVRNA